MKKKKTAIYTPELIREVYAAAKKNGTSLGVECAKRKLNLKSLQCAKSILNRKTKKPRPYIRKTKPQNFIDINIPQAPPQPQSDMVAVFMVPRSGVKSFMEALWQ